MKFANLKTLTFSTIIALGIQESMAMESSAEKTEPNYFKGVAKFSDTMTALIPTDRNTLFCPLGSVLLLEKQHNSFRAEAKAAIEELVGHPITPEGFNQFNVLLENKSCEPPKKTQIIQSDPIIQYNQYIVNNTNYMLGLTDKTFWSSKIVALDYEKPQESMDKLNELVSKDTNEQFMTPLKTTDLTHEEEFLISTFSINAQWVVDQYAPGFNDKVFDFGLGDKKKAALGFGGTAYLYYSETPENIFLTIPAFHRIYFMIKMNREGKISPITSTEWEADSAMERIKFTMPSFSIESTLNIADQLKGRLPLKNLIQQNKLEVSRNGLMRSLTSRGEQMFAKCKHPDVKREIDINLPFSYILIQGIGYKPETKGSKDFLFLAAGTYMG